MSEDSFLNQLESKTEGLIPKFKKSKTITHIVYKEVRYHHILNKILLKNKEVKVIGLVRNPFDVVNSWLNAPKEFKKSEGWKIDEEWRFAPSKNKNQPEEFNGYEKWKEVAILFLKLKEEFPNRFYLLEYEKLVDNTKKEVEKLFSFCELKVGKQTCDFLNKSTKIDNPDPYSVYKSGKSGTDDKWKKELPEIVINEIKNDPDFIKLNQIFKWI